MDIINRIYDGYQFLADNAYMYQSEFFSITLLIVLMIIVANLNRKSRREWRRFMRRMGIIKGIQQMTKEEYREHLKTIKGDAVFNALEDLVEAGKITRHDCTKTLRSISNILNIPGFVSQEKLDLTTLTAAEFEEVQSILRNKKKVRELIFRNQKPNIPKPDPKIENNLAAQRRAQMLAKQAQAEQANEVGRGSSASVTKKVFGGTLLKRKTAIV